MIPGYNHNIRYKDRVFHVQTEDSGTANPHIITHLFVGGNIIESRKTSYAEHVGSDRLTDVVVELMQAQHKGMLRDLIGGKCDDKIATRSVNAATLNGPAPLNVDAGAQHRSSLMVGQAAETPAPKPAAPAAATPSAAPSAPAPKPATPAHLITRMPTVPAPAPHVPASAPVPPVARPAVAAAASGPSPVLPAAPTPRPAAAPPIAPIAAATPSPTRFPVATPTPAPSITAFAPRTPSFAAPPSATVPATTTGARPIQTSPPPPAKPAAASPAAGAPVIPAAAVAAKAAETVISADTLARAFGAPSDSAVDSIFGEDLISEKSLDEVILSYLADDIRRE